MRPFDELVPTRALPTSPVVRTAKVADRDAVTQTIAAAFRSDPAFRYFFPVDDDYDRQARHFAGYLFDRRVKRNSVWVTEGCLATSLWSPPGDEHAAASPTAAHAREVMLADIGPDAAQRLTHYDTVVASSLADAGQGPYWYFGILASHPDCAGSGLGRAVMTTGIEHVRKLGRTALLDTSNPRDDVADGGRGERLVAGGAASGLLCHQITRQSPSAWV